MHWKQKEGYGPERERGLGDLVNELKRMGSGWEARVKEAAYRWIHTLEPLIQSPDSQPTPLQFIQAFISKSNTHTSAFFTVLKLLNFVFGHLKKSHHGSRSQIQSLLLKSGIVPRLLKGISKTKKEWKMSLHISLLIHLLHGPNL